MTTKKFLLATTLCAAVVLGGLGSGAAAFADEPSGWHGGGGAVDDPSTGGGPLDDSSGKLVIYEPAPKDATPRPTPPGFRLPLPGMTPREDSSSGAGGARSSKGGDKSTGGDKSAPDEPTDFINPFAGTKGAKTPTTLDVFRPGADADSFDRVTLTTSKDLAKLASVEPITGKMGPGMFVQTGVSISFTSDVMSSAADVTQAIFTLSRGGISSCKRSDATFVCTFTKQRQSRSRPTIDTTGIADFAPPAGDEQPVPLCTGQARDGGFGIATIISVADVSCDASADVAPVGLEIGHLYTDPALGIPTVRPGDGSIVYDAPQSAQGQYVTMQAWAVAADGTTSWPFYVAIRNRYAPEAKPQTTIEAVRGVDTVIPARSLFSDEDVDLYGAESGDHLTSTVTSNAAEGGAWFDGAGNLHFQSIDVIHGDYTDHVTVKAVDAFGLPSPELTLTVHVSDLMPGCATSGTTTDTVTPVRIELRCWITPVAGWRQIAGLDYSLVEAPAFGTLSAVDPVSGTATYTPDPAHAGPVSLTFRADNNGASRDAVFTVNVTSAP
ncbi:hypothetical protein [Subtercola sp. RTI3]|uniref:hypothetical protein n=1 Tax=Subtercola sp. RTI3 TaxID=3048639 RepID=UPI002B23C63E|nr:hypothetical protein [Subtercola sp. RTI3]MEA9983887.1 hypothetical protein [Subtercola sp. RTI3]